MRYLLMLRALIYSVALKFRAPPVAARRWTGPPLDRDALKVFRKLLNGIAADGGCGAQMVVC